MSDFMIFLYFLNLNCKIAKIFNVLNPIQALVLKLSFYKRTIVRFCLNMKHTISISIEKMKLFP